MPISLQAIAYCLTVRVALASAFHALRDFEFRHVGEFTVLSFGCCVHCYNGVNHKINSMVSLKSEIYEIRNRKKFRTAYGVGLAMLTFWQAWREPRYGTYVIGG